MDNELKYLAALEDIVKYGDSIAELIKDKTYGQFLQAHTERLAIERCITVIGQAVVRIRKLSKADSIPDAAKIIAFRNMFVHEYDAIEQPNVWSILKRHVPALVVTAKVILDDSPEQGDLEFNP